MGMQENTYDIEEAVPQSNNTSDLKKAILRSNDLDVIARYLNPDSSNPLNPQNWPKWKKLSVFLALMSSSVLCDGGMTWGVPLFVEQAAAFEVSISRSTTSINYGLLLQGLGGLLAVPFIEKFGRYSIWFWTQVLALGMVIGASLAPSFDSFVAFRSLQGLFGTIPQVVGLPIIHDMYVPEDWPRMINIWDTVFLVGPFLGPALAGYLSNVLNWHGVFAVLAALYSVSTILVFFFGRETYFAPTKVVERGPSFVESLLARGGALSVDRPSFTATAKTLVKYIFRLPLLLVAITSTVNSTWPIGIIVTVDSFIRAPPYFMNDTEAASMRWAAVLGALTGWAIGYFFNDWISRTRVRRPDWRPEIRLHGVWIPSFCLVCGLLTYGLCINFNRSWVGLAFGWFGVNIGLIGTMVAITSFALERYAEEATIVSAILNMSRTTGGFSVSYYQSAWISHSGVGVVFGYQAAIFAVSLLVLIPSAMLLWKRSSKAAEKAGLPSGGRG